MAGYYVANEVAGVSRGMMIAIPAPEWNIFGEMSHVEFVAEPVRIASYAPLSKYRQHPRGPKKPAPKTGYDKKRPHVSTVRLIRARVG